MIDWLYVLGGFALLIGSAEFLVRGAVWCARSVGVSPMMVGLTLVAFGTSAPELFVGMTAAFKGAPDIATGGVLGSNVANIGLIVGLTAMLRPIEHPPRAARFECRMLVLCSALLLLPLATGMISSLGGALLLTLLVGFTAMLVRREMRRKQGSNETKVDDDFHPGAKQAALHIAYVLGGLAGLKFGGDLLVEGAEQIASTFGMSKFLIGQTVVAVGTSLPELATSIVAARRGHPEIALGNVLGSNIFNVCMVLGASALITDLPMSFAEQGPAVVLGLVMAFALTLSLRYHSGVLRRTGTILLLTWIAYMTFSILQGTPRS